MYIQILHALSVVGRALVQKTLFEQIYYLGMNKTLSCRINGTTMVNGGEKWKWTIKNKLVVRSKGGLRKLTTEKPRQSKKARSDRRESLVVCVFDNKAN